jgi:hypothetical protein
MTERFYSIKHLTTAQLRELYSTYRLQGWIDGDYYKLTPAGVKPPELPEWEILRNITAGDDHNYFVFMLDCEGEQDGIMIGFGMSLHKDFAVYLHLPPGLLNEIVEKYGLYLSHEGKGDVLFYHERKNIKNILRS